jgi:hypothetical protein
LPKLPFHHGSFSNDTMMMEMMMMMMMMMKKPREFRDILKIYS